MREEGEREEKKEINNFEKWERKEKGRTTTSLQPKRAKCLPKG